MRYLHTSLAAGLLILCGCSRAPATDVLVVGSGIAGLSAALEAGRAGATVRVIEMSSVFGGHAVMAHGGLTIVETPVQEAAGVADSVELAERDFLEWGEDAEPHWVAFYVRNSDEMLYDWLLDLGVEFSERLLQIPGNRVPRFHSPGGRGLGLVGPIYRACLALPNISFEWNTEVDGLLAEDGRVVGVTAQALRSGRRVEFRASHTLLATGGFQSNLQMVRDFWPEAYAFPERILIGSGIHSTGSGHRVAQAAGAALIDMDRQWNYATGLPDPRFPGRNRGLNAHNGAGVWVNLDGRRFVNETGSTKERFRALLRQDQARFWLIFDERGKRRLFVSGSQWAEFDTVERVLLSDREITRIAPTLERLAADTELPANTFTETIALYNRQLAEGRDEDFHRFGFGGVPYDLAPWAEEGPIPIEQPPFYALSLFPLARKSMGGIAIDDKARVVDESGDPIPGLLAAGEVTGFAGINGWAGLEGTFLGPALVTGRVAAQTIVAGLPPGERATVASDTRPATAGSGDPFDNEECLGCHALPTLVAEERPGYWHFNRTHSAVLERTLECRTCHAELYPFRARRHRRDPVALSRTCELCHLAREH